MKTSLFSGMLLLLVCTGCSLFKKSAKDEFVDGYYRQTSQGRMQRVYVNLDEEAISVYPVSSENKRDLDTTRVQQYFSEEIAARANPQVVFRNQSTDVDFLTIPLKFRFSTPEVPRQLNSNLNGALYLGMRTDQYKVHYHMPPLGKAERHVTHLGFSAGIFSGLGSTAVTPTTTHQQVDLEYDGLIWSKGIAGIVAIDNFSAGLAIGVDNLLDQHKKYWVYQYKPWIGVAFGLNLN